MIERAYIDGRLTRIEAELLEVLKKHGYPAEPDAIGKDGHWRKLQLAIRGSRTPYDRGDRVRRALAGLLLVRQCRDALEAWDVTSNPDALLKTTRYALDLGPLQNDVLTHALAIIVDHEIFAGLNALRQAGQADYSERGQAHLWSVRERANG